MRLLKSLLLSLIVLLLGLVNATPAYAAATNPTATLFSNWVDSGYPQAFKACMPPPYGNNENNGSCYVSFTSISDMNNLTRLILGPVSGVTVAMGETDQNYISQMYQGSAMAGINSSLAYLITTPPADLALWVRDTGQTLGFIPRQAHAQGIGFSGLTPILPVWKGFRNIAYVLLALVMVVVGFMVMLRRRIDPKTVVTVQNSLPRIVIVLLLITFSYAIAGLLIDLMYLTIALGIAILDANLPGGAKVSLLGQTLDFISGGFTTLLFGIFAPLLNASPLATAGQAVLDVLKNPPQGTFNILRGLFQFATNPGQVAQAGAQAAATVVIGPILGVLISLLYLFAFIRILIMLLMAYVNILLSVLVGPIQILLDAIPGNNAFVSWLKNLVMNLIPFPITIFMIILGNALNNLTNNTLWTPPLLPQWGGAASYFATTILWLGIILTIPSIVSSIKEALKAKPAVPMGGLGGITGVFGTGMQLLSAGYYIRGFTTKSVPEKLVGKDTTKSQ